MRESRWRARSHNPLRTRDRSILTGLGRAREDVHPVHRRSRDRARLKHNYAITYTRGRGVGDSVVEFFLDGRRVTKVKDVGVPVDKQAGQKYTGLSVLIIRYG